MSQNSKRHHFPGRGAAIHVTRDLALASYLIMSSRAKKFSFLGELSKEHKADTRLLPSHISLPRST